MDFAGGAPGRPRHPQLKCCRYFGSRFQTDAVLQPKKKANLWSKTASRMNSWEKSAKLPGIFGKTSHKCCHYPAVCDDCPLGRHFSPSSRWHGLPHRPPPREWGFRGFGDGFQVVKGQVVFTTALNIRQLWTFETHCHRSGDCTPAPLEWFRVLYSGGRPYQSQLCHESCHSRPPSAGFRGRFSVSR